jgi:hypothetical protein
MGFPCPNYKTDPAEFERMKREHRRANRIANAVVLTVVVLLLLGLGRVIYGVLQYLA